MFIKVQLAGLSVQLDTNPIGSLQRSTLCLLRQRQTGKINIRQNVCKLLNCGQKSLFLIPARAASLFRLSLLFKEILSQWVHWFYQRRSGIRKNPTKRSKISFDFGDILLFYRLNVPLSEPAGQFRFETNNNNWHHQARNFTCFSPVLLITANIYPQLKIKYKKYRLNPLVQPFFTSLLVGFCNSSKT